MKKKVCIIHSFYYPDIIGGAEISTKILSEQLNNIIEVEVLTVGGSKEKLTYNEIYQVPVYRLPYNNLYWLKDAGRKNSREKVLWHIINSYNIVQYERVKELLTQNKPEIVHTQNLSGLSVSVWKAASELNIPIVHTLRDYSLLRPVNSRLFSYFSSSIAKYFSKYVSAVIGISQYILDEHINGGFFKEANKYVIPNVVENKSISKKKVSTRDSLKLGYFGQLTSNKGVDSLLKALSTIPEHIVSDLYICGEGPEENNLKEISKDNRIKYLGKLPYDKVIDIMQQVDLTVVPSTWEEPFGRVIIESYQAGTPVIASKVGGIPEILIDSSKYSFTPNSPKEITESIIDYYNYSYNDKKDIQDVCIKKSEEFNVENMIDKHLNVYEKL
ncbi:glycosyltransferase family 4 protein [Halobacillus sp. SY10]|uniref:glycosyltransferase family 4 protein n=1 Tax=Halobacillus sp. SY10 TaxID=3381356 RepID=UPI003879F185